MHDGVESAWIFRDDEHEVHDKGDAARIHAIIIASIIAYHIIFQLHRSQNELFRCGKGISRLNNLQRFEGTSRGRCAGKMQKEIQTPAAALRHENSSESTDSYASG